MRDLVIFAASFYSLNQDVVGASVFAIHPQEQEKTGSLNSIEARRVYLARILCPETGLGEIDGDLPQADFSLRMGYLCHTQLPVVPILEVLEGMCYL
jgi:hypothetical protein